MAAPANQLQLPVLRRRRRRLPLQRRRRTTDISTSALLLHCPLPLLFVFAFHTIQQSPTIPEPSGPSACLFYDPLRLRFDLLQPTLALLNAANTTGGVVVAVVHSFLAAGAAVVSHHLVPQFVRGGSVAVFLSWVSWKEEEEVF